MFEINVRSPGAKPGTFGWYMVKCSHCGSSAEKTINFRAFDQDGNISTSCHAEICLECLKQAIQQLERRE